jgi:hypothetical protein
VGLILCAGALRALHSVLYGVGVYDVRTVVTVILIPASVLTPPLYPADFNSDGCLMAVHFGDIRGGTGANGMFFSTRIQTLAELQLTNG